MGFRYRKSIKLGPFRLNLSKKGAGVSVGVKGARVGIGPRGLRTTLSVPGTGMSYVSEKRLKGSSAKRAARLNPQREQIVQTKTPRPYRGTRWLVGAMIGVLMLGGTNPGLGLLITIGCGARYYFVRKWLKRQSVVSNMEVTESADNFVSTLTPEQKAAFEFEDANERKIERMVNKIDKVSDKTFDYDKPDDILKWHKEAVRLVDEMKEFCYSNGIGGKYYYDTQQADYYRMMHNNLNDYLERGYQEDMDAIKDS